MDAPQPRRDGEHVQLHQHRRLPALIDVQQAAVLVRGPPRPEHLVHVEAVVGAFCKASSISWTYWNSSRATIGLVPGNGYQALQSRCGQFAGRDATLSGSRPGHAGLARSPSRPATTAPATTAPRATASAATNVRLTTRSRSRFLAKAASCCSLTSTRSRSPSARLNRCRADSGTR